jgi:integrase
MARRRKDIIWPRLNDCGGDLTKTWHVEYSLRNPVTQEMKRFKIYEGLKQLSTAKDRYEFAEKIIRQFTEDIKSGTIGFSESIEYDDLLSIGGCAYFTGKKKTFAGSIKIYVSEFLEYKSTEIGEKAMQTYRSKFRIFMGFLEMKRISDQQATSITNVLIIEFLKKVASERKLARKTIEKYQQILYTFFSFLIDIKKVKMAHPVMNIPRIGVLKDEAPAAIPKEIRIRLLNYIITEDPQLYMSICFIYYTAIRPGTELRLMKLSQINYDSQTITIKNFLAKNGRTEVIDIPDQLHYLITQEWKLQEYDQSLYVFGKEGMPGEQPLGKNTMRIRFNVFRNRLKLPKEIKYYSWKHSGAQELADSGASIYELQRHLRHRNMDTTEQYLKKRIGQRSNMIKHKFPSIG